MLIDIGDDAANWMKWGQLVQDWACGATPRPTDAAMMQQQISDRGITARVPGCDDKPPRPVIFYQYGDYPGTGYSSVPLTLPLPSCKMIQDDQAALSANAPEPYPLPSFYPIAFGGAPEVTLNQTELLAFALRRLGEYVIQQCQ
jgi:hypothetical protein